MRQLVLGMALMIIMYPHAIFTAREAKPRLQVDTSNAYIEYPVEGQWLQGDVIIIGNTGGVEIKSYEVEFAYSVNPSDTWFLIHESTSLLENDILATWNTAEIADGTYSLRLQVRMADDTTQVVKVKGLRVSNEELNEANSLSHTAEGASSRPGESFAIFTAEVTPNSTPSYVLGTPTPLPANPFEITYSQAFITLGKGVMISLGSFASLGIYLGLRRKSKKRKLND